jgi:putative membrane protein
MFIDFLSLLLVNMGAGLVVLAWYVFDGLDDQEQGRWAPAFGMVGLIAVVFGGYIVTHWPLPGPYNSIFGEMSVLFGIIFLGAAWALARGWNLVPVACYAFFAGAMAIISGARIAFSGLTAQPALSTAGFVLTGLGGIFACPTLLFFRHSRAFRTVAALVLVAAAATWLLTAGMEYWLHPPMWKDWTPTIFQQAAKM